MGQAALARNRLGEGFLLKEREINGGMDDERGTPRGAGGEGGSEMIELVENADPGARIKVIGAGGCGGNAVNHMIAAGLRNVEFMSVNTDTQALQVNLAPLRMAIGQKLTRGRGTGGNPEIGRKAALEDEEVLREILANAEMVFVTAGMGGGTGTGSAPVIARIARDLGALTVGVVTKPFQFEGRKRMGQAEEGLRELKDAVDTLITIPNQRLLSIASRNTSLKEAFQRADDVLLQAVRGISELVTVHGLINLDFADVRSIMAEMGMAMMGAAHASGENRAVEAAQRAISSPLLEDVSIKGARGLLINVTGGPDMSLYEVNEAASLIQEEAHEDANIIFGAVIDDKITDEIHVTVIATGFGEQETRYAPRYAPSGTAITAPVQSAPTRPMDPMQPQPMMPPPVIAPHPPMTAPSAAPVMHSTPTPAAAPTAAPQASPVQPQAQMFGGKPVRRLGLIVDESSLDIPAFKRRASERSGGPTRLAADDTVDNDDKLDIPAFLRKPVE
jgi:cell division protein FtsZ